MNPEKRIFKRGSTTYYFSSAFFPRSIKQDVFKLYSFVRTADDYVDNRPAQPEKLLQLQKLYMEAHRTKGFDTNVSRHDSIQLRVVKNIVHLEQKYSFDDAWVLDFLKSMKQDIAPKQYKDLKASLGYVYGSAEVIGLMMARIMALPAKANSSAMMQGRAMQWINFIRDIREDNLMGRCYFPLDELKAHKLPDLSEASARAHPHNFVSFIHTQIERYQEWQSTADKGMKTIPKRLRIPLQTATDMYAWTAEQIKDDPFSVYRGSIKPQRRRVVQTALAKTLRR